MWTRTLVVPCLVLPLVLAACGKDETPPKPTAPSGTTATPVVPSTPTPSDAAAVTKAATVQAQKLIDEATQYIKDNKLDLADKTISQLEAMKPNLPPDYASKIDSLRSTFNAAKASGGAGALKLPGQ